MNKLRQGARKFQENFITLELPVLKKNTWQLSYSLAVLGHELGHMYFSRTKGRDDSSVNNEKDAS